MHSLNPQCFRLAFGIVGCMSGWGIILGASLGGLLGAVLASSNPLFFLLFALIGALVGGTIGLLLGLAIGCTLILFSLRGMPTDIEGYLKLARAISVFWTIIAVMLIVIQLRVQAKDLPLAVLAISLAGLIVLGAEWWACRRVVAWVEHEIV